MAMIIDPFRQAVSGGGGGGGGYIVANGGSGLETDGSDIAGDYKYHTFTGSGTFQVTDAGSSGNDVVEYLVVAGGGGGGHTIGGGGGAGGYLASSSHTVTAKKYTVTIGAGGAAGTSAGNGSDGSPTVFGEMSPAEPTAAFTSTTNCKLLLHSDTTNGSTTFTDSAGNFSLGAIGNAQHSTTDQKFGTTSISMDGTTDEVKFSTADTTMGGSGAHTFECWFNTSSTALQYLVCRNSSQQYAGLSIRPSHATENIQWGGNTTGTLLTAPATINTGTWYHVAVVMDGSGNAEIYFDGERVASTSSWSAWGFGYASNNITIGAQHYTNGMHRYTVDGYIDEVRWSDVARYSTSSIAEATGGGGGGSDSPVDGRDGGSGGGGGTSGESVGSGGSAATGQGNDGGAANNIGDTAGGGGGGAGGAGSTPDGFFTFGDGGAGTSSSITGSSVTRGGGGGGAGGTRGSGGSGGGGQGGQGSSGGSGNHADAGTANSGGGGGGGDQSTNAAAGGSGVVIIRYQYQGTGGPPPP